MNVEDMLEFGNHYFVSPSEIIAADNIQNWTKPLDKMVIGNHTMEIRLSSLELTGQLYIIEIKTSKHFVPPDMIQYKAYSTTYETFMAPNVGPKS